MVNFVAFMLIPEVPAPQNFLYTCSPILSHSTNNETHFDETHGGRPTLNCICPFLY
jgi:hypothetical protein